MNSDQTRPVPSSGQTQPQRAKASETQPIGTGAEKPPKQDDQRIPWRLLLGLALATVLVLAFSIGSGYYLGVEDRQSAQATAEASLLQEQFDRGVVDLEEGRLALAKERFEYIIQVNPEYPGAQDLLLLAQQGLNQPTNTPTARPTEIILTPTPTLSLDTLEGLLEGARSANQRESWDEAIEIALSLRRRDPSFRLDELNQILFTALRNRGMAKIFQGEREQGIYDLRLASRVGTLDNQAQSWIRSASFYQYANSFIELDWAEAVANFADLCAAGIWDSCYKYALSAKEYGDQLMGQDEYCAAFDQYDSSLRTFNDDQLEPTADYAYESCLTATTTPPTATPTASTTAGTPTPATATPTATIGPSDTPGGASATPTASPTATATNTAGAASETPTATLSPTVAATQTPTPNP